MTHLLGWIEALLLILLGLFMVTLAASDSYWLLLNPKFKWVTAAGGLGICLAGIGLFFVPAGRPGPSRLTVMALFMGLLVSWNPEDALLLPGDATSFTGGSSDRESSRVTVDGKEYVRINTAELYMLARRNSPDLRSVRYVVQGVSRRTPDLDARGEIALLRVAVSCCLADAVGMGVRVAVEDPAAFEDGKWIRVYGMLEERPVEGKIGKLQIRGVFQTVLSETHVLVPERVEAVDQPGLPFVFEIRQKEPFAN
jgi:hypothetical protein